MRLAKDCFDLGLMTGSLATIEHFWRHEAALEEDYLLKFSDGFTQLRMKIDRSIVKLNHRVLQPATPSGYKELLVAREGLREPTTLCDSDGNQVTLVPPGHRGVTQIGVRMGVRDIEAHRRFYTEAFGFAESEPGTIIVGRSVILLEHDPAVGVDQSLWGQGWRYLTFQIFDARADHAHFIAAGGRPGTPVRRVDDIARIAMVLDPDGNWIELSQRASLTGPLGPD